MLGLVRRTNTMADDRRITPTEAQVAKDTAKNNGPGNTSGWPASAKEAFNITWDREKKGQ